MIRIEPATMEGESGMGESVGGEGDAVSRWCRGIGAEEMVVGDGHEAGGVAGRLVGVVRVEDGIAGVCPCWIRG